MKKYVKCTYADCPSAAHPFDWVACENCVIRQNCKIAKDRDGCHFGVDSIASQQNKIN